METGIPLGLASLARAIRIGGVEFKGFDEDLVP
jgi:hypothetical protein